MGVSLRDLHGELFVDEMAERRLGEIFGITDHLVLKRVCRMMKQPVQPPAAIASGCLARLLCSGLDRRPCLGRDRRPRLGRCGARRQQQDSGIHDHRATRVAV